MANLVLTNLDTGQQVVITDTLTLEQAISSVKSVCNTYTDNSSSNVLIQANNYSDSVVLNAISEILPTIPFVNYPQNGGVRLIIGTNSDGTLKFFDVRNQEYIQAGDLLSLQNSKTYTLAQLAENRLEISEEIQNSITNSAINSKIYTQAEIARVETLLQELETHGFTFDTFLEWIELIGDSLYPVHLNSTIDVAGKIQRFHYNNGTEAEFELHNTLPISALLPNIQALVTSKVKDSLHNGFVWKYVGNVNTANNSYGLFAIRNNVVDSEPCIYIDYTTGGIRFVSDMLVNGVINSRPTMYIEGGQSDSTSAVCTTWDLVMHILHLLEDGSLASLEQVRSHSLEAGVPIGSILLFPAAKSGGSTWLECNGGSYDITEYESLAFYSGITSGVLPNIPRPSTSSKWMIKSK